jgi:hypothetical protein
MFAGGDLIAKIIKGPLQAFIDYTDRKFSGCIRAIPRRSARLRWM